GNDGLTIYDLTIQRFRSNTMLAAIDSLLFLLLIAVAALFRLLAKVGSSKPVSGGQDELAFPQPDLPQQPPRKAPTDEEQIRKFLEALGQPRSAEVPQPVPPRTDIPPRPLAPVTPPRTIIPVPRTRTIQEPAKRPSVTAPRRSPDADRRRAFE